MGYRTSHTYGQFNNPLTSQNALGYVRSVPYDNMGYQTGSADPLGNQMATVHNGTELWSPIAGIFKTVTFIWDGKEYLGEVNQ